MKTMSSLKRMVGSMIKSAKKKTEEGEEETKSGRNSVGIINKMEIANATSFQLSSRSNIFVDIFHDAENCQLRNSTNGSKLYDLVVDQVMKTSFPDFDASKKSHQVAINWRLVLPFQASMGPVVASSRASQSSPSSSSSSIVINEIVDIDNNKNNAKAPFQKLKQCIRDLQTRGVIHINPGDKKGAVDIIIKDMLEIFCSTHGDDSEEKKKNRVIALLSGDRDFASNIRSLHQKGFSVILIYNDEVISSSYLDVLPEGKALGIWKTLISQAESVNTATETALSLSSPSAAKNDQSTIAISSIIEAVSSSSSSSKRAGMMYEAPARLPLQSSQPSRSGGSVSNVSVSGNRSGGSVSDSTQRRKKNYNKNKPVHQESSPNEAISRQLFVSSSLSLSTELVSAVNDDKVDNNSILNTSVITTISNDTMNDPIASSIYTSDYISILSDCAAELFLILCQSPGYCMDVANLNRFISRYPVGAKGKIADFVSRKESGDLFAWHRCWFPAVHTFYANNNNNSININKNDDSNNTNRVMTTATPVSMSQGGQEGFMIIQLRHQPPSVYLIQVLTKKYPHLLSTSLTVYIGTLCINNDYSNHNQNQNQISKSILSSDALPMTEKVMKQSNSEMAINSSDSNNDSKIWYYNRLLILVVIITICVLLLEILGALATTNTTAMMLNETMSSTVLNVTHAFTVLVNFYITIYQYMKHHGSLLLLRFSSLISSFIDIHSHTASLTDLFNINIIYLSQKMNTIISFMHNQQQ